jgi:hypothetical protein
MRWMLLLKFAVIGFLALVLVIPLVMIYGLVEARNTRQREVRQSVAAGAAGRQQIAGPVLVVTYKQRVVIEEKQEKTGQILPRTEWQDRHRVLVPKDLQVAYNVAINVADPDGEIDPGDTIWTACFLDDDPDPKPVESRTSITSQPLIHHVLVIENVQPRAEPHIIRVRWRKDGDRGHVYLQEANLTVVAFEDAF